MSAVFGRRWRLTGAVLVLVVLAGSQAWSQAEIFLKDGRTLKGWVVGDDGSKIKISLDTGGQGVATTAFAYDKLAPRTIYRLMKGKTKREDAGGQLKLASYCLDNGLYMVGRMHYRSASHLDEKQGGSLKSRLDALRGRAAGVVLSASKKLIAKGDELGAEKNLGLILKYLPDVPEAEEARKLIEQISANAMADREQKREAMAKTRSERVRGKLQGLRTDYDKAHKNVREGLKLANKPVQAIKHYRSAVSKFEKILGALLKADQEVQNDEEFTRDVRAWITTVTNDKIETQLHVASAYFTRQTLTKALEVVNSILADHPANKQALAMRGRIEVAMNDNPYGGRRRIR